MGPETGRRAADVGAAERRRLQRRQGGDRRRRSVSGCGADRQRGGNQQQGRYEPGQSTSHGRQSGPRARASWSAPADYRWRVHSRQVGSQRVVGDDGPAGTEGADRMRGVGRHDRHAACTEHLFLAGDGQGQLPVDDVPHLLLLVLVLVQRRRAGRDVVVGERHVRGMEEPAAPPGQGLSRQHVGGPEEGHVSASRPVDTQATCSSARAMSTLPDTLRTLRSTRVSRRAPRSGRRRAGSPS